MNIIITDANKRLIMEKLHLLSFVEVVLDGLYDENVPCKEQSNGYKNYAKRRAVYLAQVEVLCEAFCLDCEKLRAWGKENYVDLNDGMTMEEFKNAFTLKEFVAKFAKEDE